VSRFFSFGEPEARVYGEIRARRQAAGRAISNFDAQIAAIARCRGMALATRNVKDFADCELVLINPWEPESRGELSDGAGPPGGGLMH